VWLWENGKAEPELRHLTAFFTFLGGDPRPAPRTIGEHVVRYRETRGWSQKRLAGEFGIDPGTLSRWEFGKRHPRGALAEKINALLDWR
jgi:DNA-binding XRE family transcriptional regulator